jgi:hypothetical protein
MKRSTGPAGCSLLAAAACIQTRDTSHCQQAATLQHTTHQAAAPCPCMTAAGSQCLPAPTQRRKCPAAQTEQQRPCTQCDPSRVCSSQLAAARACLPSVCDDLAAPMHSHAHLQDRPRPLLQYTAPHSPLHWPGLSTPAPALLLLLTCAAMAPLGCTAPLAKASMVQAPACWNTMGEPPGPMDSRFTKTPTREAQELYSIKAAADCRTTGNSDVCESRLVEAGYEDRKEVGGVVGGTAGCGAAWRPRCWRGISISDCRPHTHT